MSRSFRALQGSHFKVPVLWHLARRAAVGEIVCIRKWTQLISV